MLPGFYVITLTFSSGREQLPPQQTEVCVCVCVCKLLVWLVTADWANMQYSSVTLHSLLHRSILNMKATHTSFNHNPQNSGFMYQKNLRDERGLSLHSLIALRSVKLAALSAKVFFLLQINLLFLKLQVFLRQENKLFHLSRYTKLWYSQREEELSERRRIYI